MRKLPLHCCYNTSIVDLLSVLLIAVSLSIDCLAVAIAGSISMPSLHRLQVLRVSLSFGIFQAGMLVLGWLAGQTMVDLVEAYDHWVAFGLLFLVGARMLQKSFSTKKDDSKRIDITKGLALLILSVATSIDALAVGLSLAVIESGVSIAAPATGIIAFVFTATGSYSGKRLGNIIGQRAEVLGGIVLIGIGIRILLAEIL